MLDKIRQPSRAKGLVAYIIFGAIIVVFIGFGVVPESTNTVATGVVAQVNRSQISLADFRERVQMVEKQYQMRMDQIPPEQRTQYTQMIRQRVLEDLIQYEVAFQAAMGNGIICSDAEIRDYIVDIPAFQEEGRFRRERYNAYLSNSRLSASQFEEKVRKDLILKRLQNLFQQALLPTPAETEKDQLLGRTRLNLEFVGYSLEDLVKNIPATSAEVKAFLANAENQAKVKKLYEDNLNQYAKPEQVKARHILIRADNSKPGADEAAKAKVATVQKRLEKEDFAKVAKEVSEDPGSKDKGGDLGYFSKGRMVPEFEAAVFKQEIGKVAAPIKTDFGYHLILVEDRKPAMTPTLEQVQDQIATQLVGQTKIDSVQKRLDGLVASGDEKALRVAAKEFNLKFEETGEFGLDAMQIPKLGDEEKVISAVVERKGQKGLVPQVIKSGNKSYWVIVKSYDVKAQADKDDMFASMGLSRTFADALNIWVKNSFAKADIKRNMSVVQ